MIDVFRGVVAVGTAGAGSRVFAAGGGASWIVRVMKGRAMVGSFMLSATEVPCNTTTWASTTPAAMKASVLTGTATGW